MPCRLFSLPRRLIIEMMLPKWFLALIVPMLLLADRAGLTQSLLREAFRQSHERDWSFFGSINTSGCGK